jgi:hypothetical protein
MSFLSRRFARRMRPHGYKALSIARRHVVLIFLFKLRQHVDPTLEIQLSSTDATLITNSRN